MQDCVVQVYDAGWYGVYAEPRTESGLVDVWVTDHENGDRVWSRMYSNNGWSHITVTARMYEVDSPWWKFWEPQYPHIDDVVAEFSNFAVQKHQKRVEEQENASRNCTRLKERYDESDT